MFTLLQVGGMLKSINASGGLSPALTLPSSIQLATNRVPRFAKFKRYAIVVNTPTRPLSVDVNGVVRPLTLNAPIAAPVLTGATVGTLSGSYLALQTYRILDALGNVISESDYGPIVSTFLTIASKKLKATYAVSSEDVTGSQLYRNATDGGTYFPWHFVADNTTLFYEGQESDSALGTVAGPALGAAPDLTLIAEWAGRLWGVDRVAIDNLRYTEAGTMYAWSGLNTLPIPHIGSDSAGITALIPRRAALGVARLDTFSQVIGSLRANFAATVVNGGEKLGCVSQESVVVFNDIAYFLWRDGVYKWDSNGITSITNGLVRTWFTTDTYFNRSLFWRAFAQLDPVTLKYRLFLAGRGSANVDRWIEYDLLAGTWWGPHKTDAFTPMSAVMVAGANQQPYPMIGGREGYLSQDQRDKNDWGVSPIDFDVEDNGYDMLDPEQEKFFGELSVIGKAQPGTMIITPTVGELENAVAGAPFTYTMSNGRERLGRIGQGKYASLQFRQNTLNHDVELYGIEINPVNAVGRR